MLSKKKGISTLIAVILLIVVAVILVTIILSFSTELTNKSLQKADNFGDLKKSDVGLFIYPKTYKDGTFQFTYSPTNDLKGKEVIITHYQILEIPEMGTKEILAQTLSEGTNIFNLECLYEYHLLKPEFTVQLITSDNTYISIKQRDAGMVCTPEGTGTEVDPIMICNAEDLNGIKEDLNLNYSLGKDIDLQCFSRTEDETAGFLPIGNNTTKFSGSFNGNNKTISNLYINRPTTDNVGLFGVLNYQGSISNLILKDVEVTGQNYVGGLLGNIPNNYSEKYDEKGDGIFGNKVTGEVVGRDYVGGLVGYNDCSVFENNSFIGSVLGNDYVGGFVGEARGLYRNNFSGGTVTGNNNVGGFGNLYNATGYNNYSTADTNGNNFVGGFSGIFWGKIYNSYSTGEVTGNDYVGGFIGEGGAKIYDSYSTGDVNGNNSVGGFIGQNSRSGKIYNNYSLGNVIGNNNVGGFIGIGDEGKFHNNFSQGLVSGLDYVGGFIGENYSSLTNNYSKGNVTRLSGEGTNVGGFVGSNSYNLVNNYSTGKVIYEGTDNPTDKGFAGAETNGYCWGLENNYWDMNNSEQTTSVSVATGLTTLEMKSAPDENLFMDWDFGSVWRRDVSGTVNGGYPYFSWQSTNDNGIATSFCDEEILLDSQSRYIIDTPGKLDCVRNRLSGSYVLGADIDMAGIDFEPIGSAWDSGNDFIGSFDGGGYTISNLTINRPTAHEVGLFGATLNATITDVNLENVNIIGSGQTGALVGVARYSSISNCSVDDGSILGESRVGGLVGELYNFKTDFLNNNFNGSVSGTNHVGGLIGEAWGSRNIIKEVNISNCYSSGSVSGISSVGGLVGHNNTVIDKSYSISEVQGDNLVGGFIGSNGGIIINSYSLGNVVRLSGTFNTTFGGFVGSSWSVTINNCYSTGRVIYDGDTDPTDKGFSENDFSTNGINNFWDMNTSLQTTSGTGATGKTTTQMKTQSTFTDWDFDTIWTIEEGESYPYLRTNEQIPHPPIIMVASNYISGTYNLATLNITLESTGDSIYYTTNGTEPSCSGTGTLYSSLITIITGTTTIKAIGCKDGYNSRVTSFTYILPEPNNIMTVEDLNNIRNNLTGFYVLGADIDLNVSPYNEGDGWEPIGNDLTKFSGRFDGNGYIISNLYINRPTTYFVGLFGYTNTGAIINDIELENVNLIGNVHVGGLVGANVYGIISNSSSEGSVSGVHNVGGLVGVHSFGIISNSFSTAFVLGQNYVGGFVGLNNNGTISNSYALGEVTRTSGTETFFGGFLGNDTGITNICYSTGRVIYTGSTNPTDRGFSGNTVTGSGNFWDVNTSGQITSASGATGKTTSEMKTQSTFTDWDFTDIWNITEGTTYPYLRNNTQSPLPQ